MTTPRDVLVWIQIVVNCLTLLSVLTGAIYVAFLAGRVYARMEALEHQVRALKDALFGGDDGGGIFLRRAEAEIIFRKDTAQKAEFDRRLTQMANDVGRLKERIPRGR